MTHYEYLHSTPAVWMDRLMKMVITSTKFRGRESDQGRDKKKDYKGNWKLENVIGEL